MVKRIVIRALGFLFPRMYFPSVSEEFRGHEKEDVFTQTVTLLGTDEEKGWRWADSSVHGCSADLKDSICEGRKPQMAKQLLIRSLEQEAFNLLQ